MQPHDIAKTGSFLEELHIRGLALGMTVVALTWLTIRVVTGAFDTLAVRWPDKRLLLHQAATGVRFVLWTVGVVLGVLVLSLSKEVILTLTGAAAVTIGFALKDLVSSILAGITIFVDRPFQVGDRVTFGGFYGEIRTIGLRSVRLVTLDDNVVTIPNNKFLTEITSSGNAGALEMMVVNDFFIGVDEDLTRAKDLVVECMLASRYVYPKRPWTLNVKQVREGDAFAIRLRAMAYVLDVRYEKAFETDVTVRVMEAFRVNGIRPPAILHRGMRSNPAGLRPNPPGPPSQGRGEVRRRRHRHGHLAVGRGRPA